MFSLRIIWSSLHYLLSNLLSFQVAHLLSNHRCGGKSRAIYLSAVMPKVSSRKRQNALWLPRGQAGVSAGLLLYAQADFVSAGLHLQECWRQGSVEDKTGAMAGCFSLALPSSLFPTCQTRINGELVVFSAPSKAGQHHQREATSEMPFFLENP